MRSLITLWFPKKLFSINCVVGDDGLEPPASSLLVQVGAHKDLFLRAFNITIPDNNMMPNDIAQIRGR